MLFSSSAHCILETFILTNVIVLTATQDFLTATERRILEGLTGKKDGQVFRFEQGGSSKLTNVRAPNSHVDLVGELGNQSQHPVPLVHRTNHVSDLSGEMVNQAPVSVVTRQSAAYDLPGQHGNKSSHHVLHRQSGPNTDLGQHGKELPHPVVQKQSGPFKDLAGLHGKELPHLNVHKHSVHRTNHVSNLSGEMMNPAPVSVVTRQSAAYDLPGQHGNKSSHLIVNKQSGPFKDLAGQPGKELPHPIVHRHSDPFKDLAGQHGKELPHPIVHRQSGPHEVLAGLNKDVADQHGKELPHPDVNTHSGSDIVLPGQQGNQSPHPIVQRQADAHFDFPVQHGNELPRPAVIRQSGSYADLPGQDDNESPFPRVYRNSNQRQSSGQRGPLSLNPGTHSQSRFIDPVSGTSVFIPGQNNNIDSFQHGHSQSDTGVNTLTLDSAIGRSYLFPPRAIPQPPARRPFGFRTPRPTDTQFRNHGVSFRGPFGPPPFLLSPETRRIPEQIRRNMPSRMIIGGLPPPFPPLQPPPPRPARIGLGGILAGVIGNLFGNMFRL